MPVISTGRYSTSSSSAASYLSPSSSTVGTYRSSYDSGRPSYSNYTSGTSSSAYRSTYSTYRSGLSDTHLTSSSSRYGSGSSGYGVSRDKVSSLLPPTPPSSITNRRSESRQRDLISNNKDYTTNSTLSSTLKTANSLNRLSRFGSNTASGGGERSSSLARNLATCGVDLYEKYSPSTYVGTSSKSTYVPKTELTRSRSLSEASKFFVNNNNTPSLSNNSHYNNYNNNNNNSNDGTTAATTTDDVGSSGARSGEKVNTNQQQLLLQQPLSLNNSEFDSNKNKITKHSVAPQKLYSASNNCCVSTNSLKNNNNANKNNSTSQISYIIDSYNSRLNVKSGVNTNNSNNNNNNKNNSKNNTSITPTTSTKVNNNNSNSKQSVTASSSSSLRHKVIRLLDSV
jgi:hypothetical protein